VLSGNLWRLSILIALINWGPEPPPPLLAASDPHGAKTQTELSVNRHASEWAVPWQLLVAV
jgi:hypothetical protein